MKYLILAFFLITMACGPTEKPELPFMLEITVTDDETVPLKGASLLLNDKEIGQSNKNGLLRHRFVSDEGVKFNLKIQCPDDHTPVPESEIYITTKRVFSLEEKNPEKLKETLIRERLICQPRIKEHIVIVRTNLNEPVPVLVMGKEIAQINEDGISQFIIKGAANEDVQIIIDTSSLPLYTPASPSRLLRLPQKRRFLFFDQQFTKPEPKTIKKRKPKKKQPQGPVRI
jgi:hypothetical protein